MEFATEPDPELSRRPPRCLSCAYVLEHLETPRCPECGRWFNPIDPYSYTRKPGFVWWKYWLPGALLSTLGGLLLAAIFLASNRLGFALTIAVPFSLGALL